MDVQLMTLMVLLASCKCHSKCFVFFCLVFRLQITGSWVGIVSCILYLVYPSQLITQNFIGFCFLIIIFLMQWLQLLGRVFNILRENNPELAGDRRRTVMRPPQVLREGTKKTVFVNFMDLCKSYALVPFPYQY